MSEKKDDYWEKCKHGVLGKISSCQVKACSLHQSLCFEKCDDYEEEK